MKFIDPRTGGPAVWEPTQDQIRLRAMAADTPNPAEQYVKKARRLNAMLREGAVGGELANWLLDVTERIRSTHAGISLGVPIGFTKSGKAVYPIAGASERLFAIQNSAQPSTVAPVSQPTGTSIRTMMQIECVSTEDLILVEWGCSFDGTTATNAPGKVELFGNTVAATMSTASVSGDVTLYGGNFGGTGTQIVFGGTTHTGFATAAVTEGTVANYRMADMQLINPTTGYVKQWPLGREFIVPSSKFLRQRVTFANTVNEFFYAIWSE